MRRYLSIFVLGLVCAGGLYAQDCVKCHLETTPAIVSDWQLSRHSEMSVSCDVCHGDDHTSAADVSEAKVPTAETCSMCHPTQFQQFSKGKHAAAWTVMNAMPTTHALPVAMTEGMKGCGGCHKLGHQVRRTIIASSSRTRAPSSATRPATACHTRDTLFSSRGGSAASGMPDPATWASTIRSGRCIPHRSTVCATLLKQERHPAGDRRRADLPDLPYAATGTMRSGLPGAFSR